MKVLSRPLLIIILKVIFFSSIIIADQNKVNSILWYDEPANNWMNEALPIGNGRLGCMIFGDPDIEHIQFNEDSLWIGDETDTGAFQAFGDLYIELGSKNEQGAKIENSSRHKAPSRESIEKTLDSDSKTKWCVQHKKEPVIWQITYPEKPNIPLQSYTFTSANDKPDRDPRTWKLFGSNNDEDWVLLDEHNDEKPFPNRMMSKTYQLKNDKLFKIYRFIFQPVNKTHFQVADIALGEENSVFRVTLNKKQPVTVSQYHRELDITRAVHTVTYQKDGVKYKREYFASNPAQVLIFRLTADKKGAYSGTILLTDMHKGKITAKDNKLISSGSLKGYVYRGGSNKKRKNIKYNIALDYEAQVLVLNQSGTVSSADGKINFKNVDSLTILLAADTDYLNQRDKGWKGSHPHENILKQISAAAGTSYKLLLEEHIKNYQNLFNRLELKLGTTIEKIASLPMDQRLTAYKEGSNDPDLEETVFQYARYLIISSSRPSAMPANLQGLWNMSNEPKWRCDYHTDVNIQMNYWFVDHANLSECFLPLAEWVNSIREVRREETKKEFNTRGWISHAENGIFGGSSWKWSKGDAAWVAQNLWDHYAYTLDKEYLITRAYPVMKELCEFWEDHLKELPNGLLVSPDGFSPEHGPHEDGVSFDQQLAWDLFNNFIEASEVLGKDKDFRNKVASMKAKLLGPRIGKWGQLQEWMVDRDNPKDKHRHLSHMIAVHPGRQISPLTTPEFAEAAKVSMNARGDEATGWSRAWKINIWARLHDGDRTYSILKGMLQNQFVNNLFDMHPPFQIDGNFGYAAGICEMLVQSHMGDIHLLPALPKAWSTGYVKGIRARKDFELDLYWNKGKLEKAIVRSGKGQQCRIRYQTSVTVTDAGNKVKFDQIDKKLVIFNTKTGGEYLIVPVK